MIFPNIIDIDVKTPIEFFINGKQNLSFINLLIFIYHIT